MRLGQLARHIDTTTTEIVEFLAEKGVVKNNHPNVKLNEDEETEVINHFRPELLNEKEEVTESISNNEVAEGTVPEPPKEQIEDEVVEQNQEEPESIEPQEELKPEQEEGDVEEPIAVPTPVSVTAADLNPEDEDAVIEYEHIDVIKAPKVELPGLKVLGKIDLPEPKVKEEEPEQQEPEKTETTNDESDQPKIVRHNKRNARRKLTEEEREARRQRNKKEKAKRLARQEAKKREQEEKRLKKIKEQHYKQKINKPIPVSKSKKKKPSKKKKKAKKH